MNKMQLTMQPECGILESRSPQSGCIVAYKDSATKIIQKKKGGHEYGK
ncbi:MAG: hypothetical protein V3G42_08135 [Oscillospiraceae bacterium]